MMFLSPIISGLLLTLMPLEIAFFLDVITALIGNGIMLLVRVDSQKLNANKKKTMQMMKEGWQYIRHHDMLSKLLLFIFFVMVFISPAAFRCCCWRCLDEHLGTSPKAYYNAAILNFCLWCIHVGIRNGR